MDEKIVVTGVVSNNSAEWLYEELDNGIDLDYEEYLANIPKDELESGGYLDWESQSSTILIGFKQTDNLDDAWYKLSDGRHFGPDPSADYSAIVGETYTQVVRSKYAQRCRLCSPCYFGQGNLDEPDNDGQVLAYTLPPEVWGENKPDNVIEL